MYNELVRDTLGWLKETEEKELNVSLESHAFFQEKTMKNESHFIAKEMPPMKPPSQPKPSPKLEEYFQSKGIAKSAPAADEEAKKRANAWKVKELVKPVVLLSFGQQGKEVEFLQALAKAIDERLMQAAVVDAHQIEKEKNWAHFLEANALKWIIAPPLPLAQFPILATHYKHTPTNGAHLLGKHPMFMLSPIATYLQNPALKAELWKQLCTILKSPQ